jgi:hypothetical protein
MKNKIIAITLITVLISCKKKNDDNSFTATDVTGTSVVMGNVNKNVITPDGSGGYLNTAMIPAAGVNVSIKVNKSDLYPNSTAQGAEVYSGATDSKGNYAITVRSNANGVPAMITIDGFTGTQDTIVNGNTRTGLFTSYTGTNVTMTLYMGQNVKLDYSFMGTNVTSNPNTVLQIGTAKVTGSVGVTMLKEVTAGTLVTLTSTNIALDNQKVYLSLNKDPSTLATRIYETTTNASGYYTFDLTTVAAGTAGFSQNATIWVNDREGTLDTLKINNTWKTGRAGVFQKETLTENGIYNNSIRNAKHFLYNNFVPN